MFFIGTSWLGCDHFQQLNICLLLTKKKNGMCPDETVDVYQISINAVPADYHEIKPVEENDNYVTKFSSFSQSIKLIVTLFR